MDEALFFGACLHRVREQAPLVHAITNYVTANDCANLLLACGASPVMAGDPGEVEEMTAHCQALTINIGTLDQRTIPAMRLAGVRAGQMGRPVVLDPVGAGASSLRTKTALELIREGKPAVIRGNGSEIRALLNGSGMTRGVDADSKDRLTQDTIEQGIRFAAALAEQTGAVVAMTGEVDLVADTKEVYCIENGHPMMRKVTGTGCQLSCLIAGFLATNTQSRLQAAAGAVACMGICGEIAGERLLEGEGNATYRNRIIDAMYGLDTETIRKYLKVSKRRIGGSTWQNGLR